MALLAIFIEAFGTVVSAPRMDVAFISPETSIAELGLDSLDGIELIIELEELLLIQMPDGDVAKSGTVADLIGVLKSSEGYSEKKVLSALKEIEQKGGPAEGGWHHISFRPENMDPDDRIIVAYLSHNKADVAVETCRWASIIGGDYDDEVRAIWYDLENRCPLFMHKEEWQ